MKFSFDHALPIVMWDFTWLERHYRGGSFEDFDRVIDELVERGYEAVRLDIFPHLLAADAAGHRQDVFHFDHTGSIGFSLWGRCYSIELDVRACVVEFIHKLQTRGIKIGLSTWIREVREGRAAGIGDVHDFIRIWDETLSFLQEYNCLENVIYVDLLNEFPLWHWYQNFKTAYQSYPEDSPAQHEFYWNFASVALRALRSKWPDLRFLFSQTENNFSACDLDNDYSLFDAMDVHMWMVHNHDLGYGSDYIQKVHPMKTDLAFGEVNEKIHRLYAQNESTYNQWMAEHIEQVAALGRKFHIPVGNTEGWGTINWAEHPYMKWDLIKRAGLVSAQLAADAGFAFICSCNFCHPHFKGIWEDVAWHRQVTDVIRKGTPRY